MTTIAQDKLESVVERCESLISGLNSKKSSVSKQELAGELARLQQRSEATSSHPQRVSALCHAFRLAHWITVAGAKEAAALVQELESELGEEGVAPFHAKKSDIPAPRGGGVDTWSGDVLQHRDFTVRFRPSRDAEEGKVLHRLPGLKSSSGVYLRPHVEVAVAPFLTRIVGEVDGLLETDREGDENVLTLARSVVASVREYEKSLDPEQSNGSVARPAVSLLASMLESWGGAGVETALDSIRDYDRRVDGDSAGEFRGPGWMDTWNEVVRLCGETAGKDSVARVQAAIDKGDREATVAALADLLTTGSSRDETTDLTTPVGALLGGLGAVMITEENLRAFEWMRSEFEGEYNEEPLPGKPRDSVLEILSPGVIQEGRLVVPPKVRLSCGEVTRFHQVLVELEGILGQEGIPGDDYGPTLQHAKETASRLSGAALEGLEGLELLFDIASVYFCELSSESQTAVRTFFKSLFGAELVEFNPGEVLDHLTSGRETAVGEYPYEVELVRHASPPGTVIETLRLGLQSPFVFLPAKIRVSRGNVVEDPFLVQLSKISTSEESQWSESVGQILAASCAEGRNHEIDAGNRAQVVAETIHLHELLGREEVEGLTLPDVREFLVRQGYEPYPERAELLTADDLRDGAGPYSVTYRRDEDVGPGGVVSVERVGWRAGDLVARKARVVISLGTVPELQRIYEEVVNLEPSDEDCCATLKRVYGSRIEPHLGNPEFVLSADESATRKELLKPALEMFSEIEKLRETYADNTTEAGVLDRILDREFPVYLQRLGVVTAPAPGDAVDLESKEIDVEAVFHDQVPEGRVVRVSRRAIRRVSSSDGQEHMVRRGRAEVSAGPVPELLRHLRWLVDAAGEEGVPAATSLVRSIEQEIDPTSWKSDSVYESLWSPISRAIDDADARVRDLHAVNDDDESETETETETATRLREGVARLVRFLAEKGLALHPAEVDGPVRLAGFSELFETDGDLVSYGSDVPRGTVRDLRHRAVVLHGVTKRQGGLVVGGGPADPLRARLETIAELVPEVREVTSAAVETLRNLEDRAVISEIEGRPVGPELSREKIDSALTVIEVLQGIAPPNDPAFEEAYREVQAVLSDLSTRFSLQVFPGESDDATSLMESATPADVVRGEFVDRPRGTLSVERYGYRGEEQNAPFRVQVSLGPKPGYWAALEVHPRFRRFFGEPTEEITEAEAEIREILASFVLPDARPDDLADFAVPRFCRIHRLLEDSMRDVVAVSDLLSFLSNHLGVDVYPAEGSTYETYASFGIPERNLEIEYDYYLDDYAIDPARVKSFGVSLGSRIYSFPSFVVHRKEKSPLVTVLLDRFVPVLHQRADAGSTEEKEALPRVVERFKRYQLLSREDQDSPEGRQEIDAVLAEAERIIPDGVEVSTPEGRMTFAQVFQDVKRRTGGQGTTMA